MPPQCILSGVALGSPLTIHRVSMGPVATTVCATMILLTQFKLLNHLQSKERVGVHHGGALAPGWDDVFVGVGRDPGNAVFELAVGLCLHQQPRSL